MALGVVITGSISSAVSAQGNMTAGETLGSKVMSLAATAKIIDDKKMFIVSCPPEMTDADAQCVVATIEDFE
jgi:hypothetical protein